MKKLILFLFLGCIGMVTTNAFAGNKLANGNMESQGAWQVSYLNTPVAQNPVATWGYTAQIPAAGVGGGLHVVGVTTAGNAQYCIYQAVTLSADSVYNFDAAFKNIKLERSWCEVFIGQIPVAGQDYGDAQGTKIANYGSWDTPAAASDGTFKLNAAACKQFIPTTTGVFYFVMKMGATTWDAQAPTCDIVVDELQLIGTRTKPVVSFTADNALGFPVLTTVFTNTTNFATSYEWNFGDGSALSTSQNPQHAYEVEGKYTVTLKATNEIGETTLVKADLVTVNAKPTLPAGEKLYGGNMENPNFWLVDFLNTGASSHPVATWNYTTSVPTAGTGGCLYVNGPAGGAGIQYAIYQKVNLSTDYDYEFDGAFRDLTVGLKSFWTEIYIGTKPAGGGADYGSGQGTLIAKFDAWNAGSTVSGLNGTFKLNASTFKTYTPATTGDYYFVAKMGTWDGIGYQIALDELKLKETLKVVNGIENFNSNQFKITTINNKINIDGVLRTVELFDVSGRQIQSVKTAGTFTSNSLKSGLYIVRIDDFTTKVAVK
ncbi:MAG: PKD domain-containing protein [Paludibacter sp.]|nr:PKD domain-containing protein [Paludibacter sp.]